MPSSECHYFDFKNVFGDVQCSSLMSKVLLLRITEKLIVKRELAKRLETMSGDHQCYFGSVSFYKHISSKIIVEFAVFYLLDNDVKNEIVSRSSKFADNPKIGCDKTLYILNRSNKNVFVGCGIDPIKS